MHAVTDTQPSTATHVSFHCDSAIAGALVRGVPTFRGHIPLLTVLFRLLPINRRASLRVADATFLLDLSYSSHLACVRLGAYESLETSVVGRCVRANDNFLDVGANWGYYSAVASECIGPAGTVFAIEANPRTFVRLARMLRLSQVANVLPFNFAAGDRDDGTVSFASSLIASDAFGHIGRPTLFSRSEAVLATRLDTWWRRVGRPAFRMAKIDVEGFEPAIIDGARECLSKGVTDCVLMEVNSWTQERCGQPYEACFTKMAALGFRYVYEPINGRYARVERADDRWPVDKTFLFSREEWPDHSPARNSVAATGA